MARWSPTPCRGCSPGPGPAHAGLSSVALAAVLVAGVEVRAAGLDRSGQSIDVLFETGGYLEVSVGFPSAEVSGRELAGGRTGNVAGNPWSLGAALKVDLDERLSAAFIYDEPYGAATTYNAGTRFQSSVDSATTRVDAGSQAFTALLRYRFSERFSLHGGLRWQSIAGSVRLRGPVYGGLDGYDVRFGRDHAMGVVAGGAYEIPTLALRLAVTVSSPIRHAVPTRERFGFGAVAVPDSNTEIAAPASVNLSFQTGIAADTLLFAGVRAVAWDGFDITPSALAAATAGGSLVAYAHDGFTYALGLGRRFSARWSGAIQVGYEAGNGGLISTLGPTDGFWTAGIGATYRHDDWRVSLGARHVDLGDATAAVGGVAVAEFRDNSVLSLGLKIGRSF